VTEVYAFFAAFTIQVLMSVLGPACFVRRVQATTIPERLAQLYPGVDLSLRREHFLTRYRTLHTGIVVLGLLLLGWLFSYMRHPDWDLRPVVALVCGYFLVQTFLPLGLILPRVIRFNKAHPRSSLLEGKRTAVLQRRGLFDFVSPFTVFVAVLSYLLFTAFVIYVQQHPFIQQRPFPRSSALVLIGTITLVYAFNAFVLYGVLYRKKPNPFETHEGRVHTIGVTVKILVYTSIAGVVFMSLTLIIGLLHWQRWMPFALSVFFVITGLVSLMGMTKPPRQPGADGLGSSGRPSPGTRDLSA
jgi:hypothetical protein